MMRTFICSRTADEAREWITLQRQPGYAWQNEQFYDQADRRFDKNLFEASENVDELFALQRRERYANCQGQAIFLANALESVGIECMVAQILQPNHAFVIAKGDLNWIL